MDNKKPLSIAYQSSVSKTSTAKKDTDKSHQNDVVILSELPIPSNWMNFDEMQKHIYNKIGSGLIKTGKLAELDVMSLVILSIEYYKYFKLHAKIMVLEEEEATSGLVQVFKTGASNVTGYVSAQNLALKNIMKLSRQFGLTIRDRKEIGIMENTGQLSMEDEFFNNVM
jgi:phage terminase small subunit